MPQTHNRNYNNINRNRFSNNRNLNGNNNRIDKLGIPLPKCIVDLIEKTSNFSLYFSKMTKWQKNRNKIEVEKDKYSDITTVSFCDKGNSKIKCLSNIIKNLHTKQKNISQSFELNEINAQLISPMILGLGSGHPTEKGITLDRNTGVPYIPASTIKGVCRTAANILNLNDNNIIKYFGNESEEKDKKKIVRGQIIFLDAYPVINNKDIFSLDIMNPHYQKYYDKKSKGPMEYDNPVPITFVNIKEGTEFIFRYFFSPLKNNSFGKTDKENIQIIFEKVFDLIGFGGKTAIGYGRFKINTGSINGSNVTTQNEFEKFKAEFIQNKNSWIQKPQQSTLVMKMKAIKDVNSQKQAKDFIKGQIKEKDRSKSLMELLNS
jgi:CRISPR-associated protein Cmr6